MAQATTGAAMSDAIRMRLRFSAWAIVDRIGQTSCEGIYADRVGLVPVKLEQVGWNLPCEKPEEVCYAQQLLDAGGEVH